MLTNADLQKLKTIFVTKEELTSVKQELKHDILQFKDDILFEIKAMREELAMTIGYRQVIENHVEQLQTLELTSRSHPTPQN